MSFLGDLSPAAGLNASAANLGQNAAAMGQQQGYYGGIDALAAQNQAALNNAYGPQGFGGDTAYYAALGASYGRAVPGEIYGSSQPMGSVFDTGGSAFNTYGVSPEMWSRMSPADMQKFNQIMAGQNAQPVSNGDPGASFDSRFSAAAPAASFDDRFGQYGGATQQQQQNQPAIDAVNNFAKGVPQLSDFGPNYGNPNQSMPFAGGGGGNPYGVDASLWGRMSPGDQATFNAQMAAQGAQPSYLDAGQPGSNYNPFGSINSGQVGSQDAFGGYQPDASFDQRFGNIPGQPYGPGYFDQTFGATAGKSAYNPTAGGGYPGPMGGTGPNGEVWGSDYQAQQQAMIRDLYKTLGIVDNSGEDGSSSWPPSGNTLRPEDYFPGGAAAYSRGGG